VKQTAITAAIRLMRQGSIVYHRRIVKNPTPTKGSSQVDHTGNAMVTMPYDQAVHMLKRR